MNSFDRSKRWWFVAFALGSAVLFWVGTLIPPMQSPDEGTHLIRAYAVSKGRWLAVTPNGKMTGDVVDRQFLQYGLAGTYEWLQGPRRLTEQRLSELAAMAWEPDGSETFFESPGAAYYAPLVYLPHALGMAAGRWLGLTINASVAWASLLASTMTAALVVAAVAVWRPPVVVWGLLLLPMTVSQAASPTIDGITTGAFLLCLSLFARFYSAQQRMPWFTTTVFLVCLMVCTTCRIHTLVLLLLPFVLFVHTRQRAMLTGGIVCSAVALGWTMLAIVSTVDRRVTRSGSTIDSLEYFASSPNEFVALLYRTLISPERQEQYAHSFIGIMGWLDAPLSQSQYAGFGWGLAVMALLSVAGWHLRYWRIRLVLVGLGVLSALTVFAALALTFTDMRAATIDGVQGRYFLLPAMMVAFGVFWGRPPTVVPAAGGQRLAVTWLPMLATAVFAVACLVVLADVLNNRFHPLLAS